MGYAGIRGSDKTMSVWLECCLCNRGILYMSLFLWLWLFFLLDCGALGLVIGLFGCLPACLDYGVLGLMIGLFGCCQSYLCD